MNTVQQHAQEEAMLLPGSQLEKTTHESDCQRSRELFKEIEAALAEARACDETVGEALTRVRGMMHLLFRDMKIIRSFSIEDALNFSEWRVVVECADGREIAVSHCS